MRESIPGMETIRKNMFQPVFQNSGKSRVYIGMRELIEGGGTVFERDPRFLKFDKFCLLRQINGM